jgi:hypothetical protein
MGGFLQIKAEAKIFWKNYLGFVSAFRGSFFILAYGQGRTGLPTPVSAFVSMSLRSLEAQAVNHALGCIWRALYDDGCDEDN